MSKFLFLSVIGKGKAMDKTHRKVSALSPLDRLRIEMISKNIEDWDCLWESIAENVYMSMTMEEMRKFNAALNVIANDTMNTLSSLRKSIGCSLTIQSSEDKSARFSNRDIVLGS